jgi:hypothetical protein
MHVSIVNTLLILPLLASAVPVWEHKYVATLLSYTANNLQIYSFHEVSQLYMLWCVGYCTQALHQFSLDQ